MAAREVELQKDTTVNLWAFKLQQTDRSLYRNPSQWVTNVEEGHFESKTIDSSTSC